MTQTTVINLTKVVRSSLGSYVDEDVCEYIESTLLEDPNDSDARETVAELLRGSIESDTENPENIIASFFERLGLHDMDAGNLDRNSDEDGNTSGNNYATRTSDRDGDYSPLKKLSQAVTMKVGDVQTFASGLVADHIEDLDAATTSGGSMGDGRQSSIATFYANMIDISGNEAAMSERKRRKARQKALREEMEETERKRALQEAMDILNENQIGDQNSDELLNSSDDNRADIHMRNFDLPNLRGGGPDLLSNASLSLAHGRRYGLMGRNGCGKTTLMTFMAQRQIPNAIPKNMTMLLVRQEIVGNEFTAVDTVLKSDVKREGVKRFIKWCEEEIESLENEGTGQEGKEGEQVKEKRAPKDNKGKLRLQDRKTPMAKKALRARTTANNEAAEAKKNNTEYLKTRLSEKLMKAYEKLAQIEQEEGGDPEPRARKILSGLGFSEAMQNRPTQELSGGWRMRVSLSCALFANPSLLLLDEPTNHLDLPGVLWLESYLRTKFKGTLVVVSHDRHFLNEICTDIVHFYKNELTTYRGDVTRFEEVREEEKQRQIRLRENQEAQKVHLQKYIDLHSQAGENGVKAARQRKSKMKKLEKVGMMSQEGKRWKASYDGDAEEVDEYVEDEKVVLNFPDPGGFDGFIAKLEEVTFGYKKDNILLRDIDLTIDIKSRTAFLGRNGDGKSTLIKLVVGALKPLQGKSTVNTRARIEYLAQHQLEQLDPDGTPLQTMIERFPGDMSNAHILSLRRYLANYGLGGETLPNQQIHTMSGGQKCRLCLACALYRKPHLLILDEPTNHLDLETTEALVEAIVNFKGGVLLVSHDQFLLNSVCRDLFVVEDGKLEALRHGNNSRDAFEEYKKAITLGRR